MAPEYEVIVVGAGSTGAVVGGRLSAQGKSVLLLEAGDVYRTVTQFPQGVLDPSISAVMPGSPQAWMLSARLMDGVQRPVARGRGMGGSSSINGCYFVRASKANFDAWVALGNNEWSYENVLPYFKRSETDHDFINELHGSTGPIDVHRDGVNRDPEFTPAFIAGAREVGFAEQTDKNAGEPEGVGPIPVNVWGGRRQGTALKYLLQAMDRPDFTAIGNAYVTRLLFKASRCVGVEAKVNGEIQRFRATETVLSAGALRTPQILMLSGIGPAEHLRSHAIDVVQDLPGVGANLADHPEFTIQWDFSGQILDLPGRARLTAIVNWTAEGSERSNDLELLLFIARAGDLMRTRDLLRRPGQALKSLSKMPKRFLLAQAKALPYRIAVLGLQQEDSRGSVRLLSADPTEMPMLDYNILDEESDRRRLREGVRVAWEIFHSKPVRAVGGRLLNLQSRDIEDASSIDGWLQRNIFAVGHASCTCRMGRDTDPWAVVDQGLRVHGLTGLRVADTSIFPEIPSCGPNATAIMLGERCSDLLLGRSTAHQSASKLST